VVVEIIVGWAVNVCVLGIQDRRKRLYEWVCSIRLRSSWCLIQSLFRLGFLGFVWEFGGEKREGSALGVENIERN